MRLVTPILIVLLLSPAHARGQGFSCIEPAEPFPYQVDKSLEPELYDFTRQEFQTYLENMETYLRCLEQERAGQLAKLGEMYRLYKQNYGEDAIFKYDQTHTSQDRR